MSYEQSKVESPLQVRVLHFEGCPNHPPTVGRVRAVADRLGIEVNLEEIEVTPDDDPDQLGFRGSPTVQINGRDIDPAQRGQDNCGFGCRTYGSAGVPDEAMIGRALTASPACVRPSRSVSQRNPPGNSGSKN